jgi:hypothetical protein
MFAGRWLLAYFFVMALFGVILVIILDCLATQFGGYYIKYIYKSMIFKLIHSKHNVNVEKKCWLYVWDCQDILYFYDDYKELFERTILIKII